MKIKSFSVLFLFIIILLSFIFSCDISGSDSSPGPPVIGAAINFNGVTNVSITVNWGAATDTTTPKSQLKYKIVKSLSESTIKTVSLADAITGNDLVKDWTANIISVNADGLTKNTNYYFTVLVKNNAGLISLYPPNSQLTTNYANGTINFALTDYGADVEGFTMFINVYPSGTTIAPVASGSTSLAGGTYILTSLVSGGNYDIITFIDRNGNSILDPVEDLIGKTSVIVSGDITSFLKCGNISFVLDNLTSITPPVGRNLLIGIYNKGESNPGVSNMVAAKIITGLTAGTNTKLINISFISGTEYFIKCWIDIDNNGIYTDSGDEYMQSEVFAVSFAISTPQVKTFDYTNFTVIP
jgi:hypothetical protein